MSRQLVSFNPPILNQYEVFVPVAGHEYTHMVSNMGRIFNVRNNYICLVYRNKTEKYLFCKELNDYLPLIIMKSFCPLYDYTNMTINYKDGITFNNYLPNLEWVTGKFDPIYKKNKGFNNYACKVTPEQVEKICQMWASGKYSGDQIANELNIGRTVVYKIRQRKVFKDIVDKYQWPDEMNKFKYTDEEIHKLCKFIQDHPNLRQYEIIEATGYPKHLINAIYSRKQRTEISSQYIW